MTLKQIVTFIVIFLAVLSIIALILGIWLGFLSSFRIVFGIIYVLFIPGFVWSYVFFASADSTLISNLPDRQAGADKTLIKSSDSKKDEGIDWIERITLSIALSLALVPLTIFFLNKVGVKINLVSVVLEILGVIIIGFVVIIVKAKLKK